MAIALPRTETEVSSIPPSDSPRRNPRSRIHEFLMEDIREDILLEAELLLLSFATGIQDAAAWPDYMCFALNQTGNTLFLAIGIACLTHNQYSFPNIGVSLSMFVTGGFYSRTTREYDRRPQASLATYIQLDPNALVFCALIVQYSWPIRRDGPAAMAVIGLLAFSSGGRVAMSRSLKITEITTAMATAAFVDLVVDPDLGKLKNRCRNRRVGFLIMLVSGCFVGAFAARERFLGVMKI
ncbi:DUF1275 domain protein [Penicillium maclennaniae]|uniref:DUF1275 domain protein n=1 Tax=Penicillium maclennaniae TaxID=1343394 RepID=UPI0025416F61|nr:DUF1275 domain protein [Penicillium maclennaniae]KAJ5668056.1 DUF1275 domain protein [Penicillium maclennaniae]